MIKRFLCLANSIKNSGRCLAGIELAANNGGFNVVHKDGEPFWVRPVSNLDHGQVPTASIATIKLIDIVEFEMTAEAADGFHTENVKYAPGSIRSIRRGELNDRNVQTILTKRTGDIFGNQESSISEEEGRALNHSILLIEPTGFEAYSDHWGNPRGRFIYNDVEYSNFKITDPEFQRDFEANPDFYKAFENQLLTISLTPTFKERHWKLIAGVINY